MHKHAIDLDALSEVEREAAEYANMKTFYENAVKRLSEKETQDPELLSLQIDDAWLTYPTRTPVPSTAAGAHSGTVNPVAKHLTVNTHVTPPMSTPQRDGQPHAVHPMVLSSSPSDNQTLYFSDRAPPFASRVERGYHRRVHSRSRASPPLRPQQDELPTSPTSAFSER